MARTRSSSSRSPAGPHGGARTSFRPNLAQILIALVVAQVVVVLVFGWISGPVLG